MSQDPNQYPQNNYPQDQPYEPTIPAYQPNAGKQGNQPSSPYTGDSTQFSSSPSPYPGSGYPAPSSPYGGGQNNNNMSGYPPPSGYPGSQTPVNNPYEHPSPYGQNTPQPGMFSAQNPYGVPGGAGGGPSYPGYIPPQQPKKRKTWLWVTLGIVGGVLILGIIGCSVLFSSISSLLNTANSTATITSVATSTPDSTGNNSNAGETKVALSATGKTNVLQDVACTVTSVKIVPGDSDAQPKPGDEFIVIHVQIKNNSSDVQHYNPLDFAMIDSAGKSSNHIYLVPAAYDNQLSFGDLAAGTSIEGDLVFEVSSSDHTQTFSWNPVANEFAGNPGEAKWVLDL